MLLGLVILLFAAWAQHSWQNRQAVVRLPKVVCHASMLVFLWKGSFWPLKDESLWKRPLVCWSTFLFSITSLRTKVTVGLRWSVFSCCATPNCRYRLSPPLPSSGWPCMCIVWRPCLKPNICPVVSHLSIHMYSIWQSCRKMSQPKVALGRCSTHMPPGNSFRNEEWPMPSDNPLCRKSAPLPYPNRRWKMY